MMHTTRAGTGERLLVCLHGWGMNGEMERADFEPLFAQRPGWERLYVDLPGMGHSPADPQVTDFDSLLGAVLDALPGWTQGRPFALSGTSAGGYLARGVVGRGPEQVTGLLLRVPRVVPEWQPRTLPEPRVLVSDPALPDTLRALAPDGLTPDEQAEVDGLPVQRPGYVQATLHKFRTQVAPALAQNDVAALDHIRSDPARYSFAQVPESNQESVSNQQGSGPRPYAGPTLIVTGRQDTVVGYQDAWPLLAHYPRATYAALDRAGHEWPLPEPQQQRLFAALVHDWLDRIEELEPQ